jgi:acetyl-CoA acyltransferase
MMKQAVIVACGRSAFGKRNGALRNTRPEDLCAQVVNGVLKQVPAGLRDEIEDFVLGCSSPDSEQGANMARLVTGVAGLPYSVAAQTVNRFCASGLQAVATAANTILSGQQKVALAGGVESMSTVPLKGARYLPNPDLLARDPGYYASMGLTAENVAVRYGVSRERMDEFAAESHRKALAAQDVAFPHEIILVEAVADADGSGEIRSFAFDRDEGIRPDSTAENLARLRPLFRAGGSVTAGNSSQMTDGASAVLLMEEGYAREIGLKPLARFVSYAVSGVDPAFMGIGPGHRHPQGASLRGSVAAGHRFDRTERGVRFPGLGLHGRTGLRHGQGERKRRRHRPGASAGMHGRGACL